VDVRRATRSMNPQMKVTIGIDELLWATAYMVSLPIEWLGIATTGWVSTRRA
jgi:hypothetical protein